MLNLFKNIMYKKLILLKFALYEAVCETIIDNIHNNELRQKYLALETLICFMNRKMNDACYAGSLYELLQKSLKHANLPDECLFCVFGVFSSGPVNFIAAQTKEKVYGFDFFEFISEMDYISSLENIHKMPELPCVSENVILVKGDFKETLPGFLACHSGQIVFMYLDCDLYSSTKTVFDLCGDRIGKGTVIVFNEFLNYTGWQEGEYKAFNEFINENNRMYKYIGYTKYAEQAAVEFV